MRRYYLCKAPSNLQKCKFNWKKVTSVENAFGRVSYRKTSAQGSLFTGLTTKSEKAAATVEGLQPASSASTAELTVIYMALVCSHAKKKGGAQRNLLHVSRKPSKPCNVSFPASSPQKSIVCDSEGKAYITVVNPGCVRDQDCKDSTQEKCRSKWRQLVRGAACAAGGRM